MLRVGAAARLSAAARPRPRPAARSRRLEVALALRLDRDRLVASAAARRRLLGRILGSPFPFLQSALALGAVLLGGGVVAAVFRSEVGAGAARTRRLTVGIVRIRRHPG